MGSPHAAAGVPPEVSIPRRLLVVEDSERDFALLVRELNRAGLTPECVRIESAGQLEVALAQGPWDAILSDHRLPQFSSTAALEIVRASQLDIPFIIISGAIGEEQAADAMKAGAADYVSKANLRRLIPVLERELRDAYSRAEHRRMEAEVARLNRERETRLRQRSTLLDITNAVMTNLDRESLFRSLFGALRQTLPCDYLALALRNEETGDIEITTLRGDQGEIASCEAVPASNQILDAWRTDPTPYRLCLDQNDDTFPLAYRMREEGLQSGMMAPLYRHSVPFGYLAAAGFQNNAYTPADVEFLSEVARQVGLAIANMLAYEEIAELKARLERDKAYLLEEIKTEHNFDEMIGAGAAFRELSARISRVAPTSAPVLILGETGTGKELIARAIHNLSPRRDRPLVKVNCAAISAGLVESELFGHVKGAFTGAVDRRIGRFEFADGGTLFLDEVGELPLETQAKLLRVLQEQEFEPVGSNRSVKVDTRLIAATNRNLEDAVREGKFRSDLYYRLNVVPIWVPPLRDRRGDIPLLVSHFLAGFSRKFGRRIEGVTEEAMRRMLEYSWPGNIRELENLLARAAVLSASPILDATSLALPAESNPSAAPPIPARSPVEPGDTSIEAAERKHIEAMLARARWVIEGAHGAAQMLGLHPNTLRSRMKKLGIQRPRHQASAP